MTEPGFTKDHWKAFCRRLEAAGDAVIREPLGVGADERAEGFRYLTRLLRIGLDMHLENADPDFPFFYQASHETAKIGADNPDNHYLNASVSGARTYRVWGNRGDTPIFSFGTKANRYAIDGTMASTGELDARDMAFAPNGDFEITISAKPAAGNWLPLEDDSSMLIVRQTFFDKSRERPAQVQIECLDGPRHPPLLSGEALNHALTRTTNFVSGTAETFLNWAADFKLNNFNTLNTVDQSRFFRAGGDPSICYLHGWWSLGPHEALRIHTATPPCEGWNFQLNNAWMESLDYRHHRIHINNKSAETAGGAVTIIVAHNDPGQPNWIETAGHRQGSMLFRWTGAHSHPIPQTEVIRLHD